MSAKPIAAKPIAAKPLSTGPALSLASAVSRDDALFDEAIALFYEAGDQPALRRRGLSALAQLLDAAGAVYLDWDGDSGSVAACETAGLPADFASRYAAHWAALDPRRKFLARVHTDSIFVSHYDRDNADARGAAFFDEFLAGYGLGHSLGGNVGAGVRCRQLYVERAVSAAPFSLAEIRTFRRAVRHIANAERNAAAAHEHDTAEALAWRVLDSLPVGTIIADPQRKVLFASEAAREIMAARDGLSLHENKLQAARAFETNALAAQLYAASSIRSPSESSALLVARPSGKRPYALLIAPLLPATATDGGGSDARLAVFLADLDGRSSALAPRLTQLFGLSKAEARVAAGIVEGRRLQDIAAELAVRIPTVRTQLGAALKKVGAARQADLVRIVLALPTTIAALPEKDEAPPPARVIGLKEAS